MKEPKLDEVIEENGKHYKRVQDDGNGCYSCSLRLKYCRHLACDEIEREDKRDVIFKEVKE